MFSGETAVGLGGWIVPVALDVATKATGLLAAAFVAHFALGRGRPLARSALWNACLVGLILIPAASLILPRLSLPVLATRSVAVPAIGGADPAPIAARSEAPIDRAVTARPISPATPLAAPGRWDGATLALAGYLAVVACLLARLGAAVLAVGRLRRSARTVLDPAWGAAVDAWRGRLGIARRVAVAASGRVSVPVVVGSSRPMILLPEALVDTASPEVIDAVLLHELGHVRRGDYGWNLVRKLVQAGYWPHPLTWPLGRVAGAVREQACDDLCVHALGGASGYRASLLAVASTLVRRPEITLGLAMARTSHLARRLAWIDRTPGAAACLLRQPARVAILLGVAAFAGAIGMIELVHAQTPGPRPADPALVEPAAATDLPDAIEVEVRAHDTGRPIAGAKGQVLVDHTWLDGQNAGAGKVKFDLTRYKSATRFTFDVWADGYVQQRYDFSADDKLFPKLTSGVTIELWPGEETLGGTVVDEAGRPIAGVRVRVWGYLGSMKDKDELVTQVGGTTDAAGHWRCRSFRAMRFAFVYLTHPDYPDDFDRRPRRYGEARDGGPTAADDQAMAPLRDFTDVQVLTRGVSLAGRVVDAGDRPVAGAEVGWIEGDEMMVDPVTQHSNLTLATTDATGAFRFATVPRVPLLVQAKAGGHAPELRAVDLSRPGDAVVLKLPPPYRVTGRVVDPARRPIADAAVTVGLWRRHALLGVELRTDAAGRFRWDDAPADAVEVAVSAVGYWDPPAFRQMQPNRIVPDGGDVTLTLRRPLSLWGTIRDEATGQLVTAARVDVGITTPATGEVAWREWGEVYTDQGRYLIRLPTEAPPEYRLRFRAKGYEPYQTGAIRSDAREIEFNVTLPRANQP